MPAKVSKRKVQETAIIRQEIKAVTNSQSNVYFEAGLWEGIHSYADLFADRFLLVFLIREGVSYSFFGLIREHAPFDDTDWAALLGVSSKTLLRYGQADASFKFKPLQSERILEMAEVTALGMEVFGEMERFKQWLQTPSYALGNLTPMELLKDSYGKELVIAELTRTRHGIFV